MYPATVERSQFVVFRRKKPLTSVIPSPMVTRYVTPWSHSPMVEDRAVGSRPRRHPLHRQIHIEGGWHRVLIDQETELHLDGRLPTPKSSAGGALDRYPKITRPGWWRGRGSCLGKGGCGGHRVCGLLQGQGEARGNIGEQETKSLPAVPVSYSPPQRVRNPPRPECTRRPMRNRCAAPRVTERRGANARHSERPCRRPAAVMLRGIGPLPPERISHGSSSKSP